MGSHTCMCLCKVHDHSDKHLIVGQMGLILSDKWAVVQVGFVVSDKWDAHH